MKLLVQGMTTTVQIGTDQGVVRAVVEPEKKISAAYQNMRSIPTTLTENYGYWVEILDLSHNKLRDVSFLNYMTTLHTLILDHNLLVSKTLFPKLPNLQVLWVNFNLISDATLFVPPLASSCPNLRHLSLMGNMASPITLRSESDRELETYRLYVISHFERMEHLDDKPVSPLERLHGRQGVGEVSLIHNVQNFWNDVKNSVMSKVNRNFNSIV